jgi:hypothetical protein
MGPQIKYQKHCTACASELEYQRPGGEGAGTSERAREQAKEERQRMWRRAVGNKRGDVQRTVGEGKKA